MATWVANGDVPSRHDAAKSGNDLYVKRCIGVKVCFWGNQGNASYRFCKWLHAKGIGAELYMMKNDNVRSFPDNFNVNCECDVDSEWLHVYNNNISGSLYLNRELRRHIETTYDAIVVVGVMGMLTAHWFNIPIVSFSTGPSNQGVIKMWDHLSFPNRLKWAVGRYLTRRSVRKCYKVLVHYEPEIYSLASIGQEGKQLFFGMPEDVRENNNIDQVMLATLNARYSRYDKVFMWLGRISFSDSNSPMYKGADKFLMAASRLLEEGRNFRLIVGEHGEDLEAFRAMVLKLGLSEHVDWVQHMPTWKLQTYLSISNAVIVDELTEFNCVSSGIFRECLSVGGVLIRSYSEILTSMGYAALDCPVLHAKTAEETYARMAEVMTWSKSEFAILQQRSRDWAMAHMHWESRIEHLLNVLREAIYVDEVARRLTSVYR